MSRRLFLLLLCLPCLVTAGCQAMREMAALRNVEFALDSVANGFLAGIDLQRVRSFSDLSAGDVFRLSSSVSEGNLPLEFDFVLEAENPAENDVTARMAQMEWTFFIDDRETISGIFKEDIAMPPGQPTLVPIPIRLNLVDFFESGARDLFELALAVAGQGDGVPRRLKLQAVPTIETSIGPIRYPRPITILAGDVG